MDNITTEKEKIDNSFDLKAILDRQPQLSFQSYETLKKDVSPITYEIMSRQATINIGKNNLIPIGTIGHVAHGKTTVVKMISGVNPIKYKIEQEKNITYKLGYANAKLFKCAQCKSPDSYKAFGSEKEDKPKCDSCGGELELLRHISFVDCPGHDILMATMLNGAAVMDAALLLVAANEPCPQPQTSEHLAAVGIMKLNNIIILQNKIDLVRENVALEQHENIKKFIQGSAAQNSKIIPISAQQKFNLDVVIEYLCKIPVPLRDFTSDPKFIVVRSFDVNDPGTEAKNLKGGIAGGTLIKGVLKLGQEIEIRPGLLINSTGGQITCQPLIHKIVSLRAENNDLIYAVPGGLIGVGLTIDPFLTKGNRLVGKIMGLPGKLPDIYKKLEVKCFLLRRLLGVKNKKNSQASNTVHEIKKNEMLLLNVGSTAVTGKVIELEGQDIVKFEIVNPVCAEKGENIAISRKIDDSWRLIGWGEIQGGVKIDN